MPVPAHRRPITAADVTYLGCYAPQLNWRDPVTRAYGGEYDTVDYTDGQCCIGPDGHLWFTDHKYASNMAPFARKVDGFGQDFADPPTARQLAPYVDLTEGRFAQEIPGRPKHVEGFRWLDGEPLITGIKNYSVGTEQLRSFFIRGRAWHHDVHPYAIHGYIALLPEPWQGTLDGNVLMCSIGRNNKAFSSEGLGAFSTSIDPRDMPGEETALNSNTLLQYIASPAGDAVRRHAPYCERNFRIPCVDVVGNHLIGVGQTGNGFLWYDNGDAVLPDGTAVPQPHGFHQLLPAGAKVRQGSDADGQPRYRHIDADETFALEADERVSSNHLVQGPDGTVYPQGHVFAAGTVFGPGWRFSDPAQPGTKQKGFHNAFGRTIRLMARSLDDLAAVRAGLLDAHEPPELSGVRLDEMVGKRFYLKWQVLGGFWDEQAKQLHVVVRNWTQRGQRPVVLVFELAGWISAPARVGPRELSPADVEVGEHDQPPVDAGEVDEPEEDEGKDEGEDEDAEAEAEAQAQAMAHVVAAMALRVSQVEATADQALALHEQVMQKIAGIDASLAEMRDQAAAREAGLASRVAALEALRDEVAPRLQSALGEVTQLRSKLAAAATLFVG